MAWVVRGGAGWCGGPRWGCWWWQTCAGSPAPGARPPTRHAQPAPPRPPATPARHTHPRVVGQLKDVELCKRFTPGGVTVACAGGEGARGRKGASASGGNCRHAPGPAAAATRARLHASTARPASPAAQACARPDPAPPKPPTARTRTLGLHQLWNSLRCGAHALQLLHQEAHLLCASACSAVGRGRQEGRVVRGRVSVHRGGSYALSSGCQARAHAPPPAPLLAPAISGAECRTTMSARGLMPSCVRRRAALMSALLRVCLC